MRPDLNLMKKKIIFLVGPTAVGKTGLSIQLARGINAEIISCDSMQIYKGIDIMTQKPTLTQRKKVPHHLVDFLSLDKNFNVGDYRKKAMRLIRDIEKRGKVPLFVGGTALYMKAVVDGLFSSPKADFKLRVKILSEAKDKKESYLYECLKKVDPKTAKGLHQNDIRRIVRALEVFEKTGLQISDLKKETKGLWDEYSIDILCINRPRLELYDRINSRVDSMFKRGIVTECKKLIGKRISRSASQALGLKEVNGFLEVIKSDKSL